MESVTVQRQRPTDVTSDRTPRVQAEAPLGRYAITGNDELLGKPKLVSFIVQSPEVIQVLRATLPDLLLISFPQAFARDRQFSTEVIQHRAHHNYSISLH